jgi:lipid-A-disaccharide synthase
MKHIMISAGEASGDMHAANIIKELRAGNKDIEIHGMGSQQMRDAGARLLVDCTDIAVMGIIEVLFKYGLIKKALNILRESLRNNPPDLLVLVDYQAFNFKLAQTAKELNIKVLFYISPKIWAWRPGRVHKIKKIIDMMAVILPFEEKIYRDANVPVRFVGNPLVDKAKAVKSKASCLNDYGLMNDKTIIGLFPGSRQSEIKRILPILLAAARLLIKDKPDLQFILPIASTLKEEHFTSSLNQYADLNIKLVKDLPYNVMQCCDVIMAASGTATLEIALMGIPSCIAYKVSTISYFILKPLVKVKHIGLVNIVAEKEIVKEFLQFDAKPEAIAKEVNLILDNENYRLNMITELKNVQKKLGKTGGIENMAELIEKMLG